MAKATKKATKKKTTAKKATAKKTTAKKATAKKTTAKKATAKKATAKKATVKKATAKKAIAKVTPRKGAAVSPQERWNMIAQAAYLKAEKRGFTGGHEYYDWIEAEKEVSQKLK